MKVYKYKDYEKVSEAASTVVIREVIKNPNIILGLATGTSPIGIYNNLIKAYNNQLVTFENVKTFNLDEYIGIDKFHPQSYYSFMYEHLFNHIDIKDENINMPSNELKDIHVLAEQYNKKMFGNQRDLQILGIGANAHIGFNEPGSKLDNQAFIIELNEETRKANSRFFDTIEEVPKHAVTMGIKNIMFSKQILLVATGKEKAEAVYNMIYGKITEDIPASILQLHPNVTIMIDEDAASKLNMDSNYLEF